MADQQMQEPSSEDANLSLSSLAAARHHVIRTQCALSEKLTAALGLTQQQASTALHEMEGSLVSTPLACGQRVVLPAALDHTHLDHPLNTYWLVPGQLMAGEYPGAANLESARTKLDDLLDRGFTAFLDLTEAGELVPYEAILAESAEVAGIDVAYLRIPIVDLNVPRHSKVMHEILNQMELWGVQGRQVYFHCWGGVGRTGTVSGCYLRRNGHSGDAALALIQNLWTRMSANKHRRLPHSPQTEAQVNYVRQWHLHDQKAFHDLV